MLSPSLTNTTTRSFESLARAMKSSSEMHKLKKPLQPYFNHCSPHSNGSPNGMVMPVCRPRGSSSSQLLPSNGGCAIHRATAAAPPAPRVPAPGTGLLEASSQRGPEPCSRPAPHHGHRHRFAAGSRGHRAAGRPAPGRREPQPRAPTEPRPVPGTAAAPTAPRCLLCPPSNKHQARVHQT